MTADNIKQLAGYYAADLVPENAVLGLGTGSTVFWLIKKLGEKVKQGLNVTCIPTSAQSEKLALENGLQTAQLNEVEKIDLCIDGADEINQHFSLIKGGGGALLREKMVASASGKLYIIADHKKLVDVLGKFPVPVEVVTYGWQHVARNIESIGCYKVVARRSANGDFYVTDNGNYILDCQFKKIYGPNELNLLLKNIPGVVETGLFVRMTKKLIIAFEDGTVREFDNLLMK